MSPSLSLPLVAGGLINDAHAGGHMPAEGVSTPPPAGGVTDAVFTTEDAGAHSCVYCLFIRFS